VHVVAETRHTRATSLPGNDLYREFAMCKGAAEIEEPATRSTCNLPCIVSGSVFFVNSLIAEWSAVSESYAYETPVICAIGARGKNLISGLILYDILS